MKNAPPKRRVLIIGGGLAGLAAARELRRHFSVTVVDAKEYFEFTSGVFRAFAQPRHWESLTFLYQDVLERRFGVKFIWGEVLDVDQWSQAAKIQPMFSKEVDTVVFDFCLVAIGCSFNQFTKSGESPWVPSIHGVWQREDKPHGHLDQRFLEGRRRRILEEYHNLLDWTNQGEEVLIVGAGFQGVEWACELKHFFPAIRVTVVDFLPRCLGHLPHEAAKYCEEFMKKLGVRTFYKEKFDPQNAAFWRRISISQERCHVYYLSGVKSSCHFMERFRLHHNSPLSETGPGGGGWILNNQYLQVATKDGVWGHGHFFAVGDCVHGSVARPSSPSRGKTCGLAVPKTGFSAEEQAVHACVNIRILDRRLHEASCLGPCTSLRSTWYPWGAGIFSISLGPNDACLIVDQTEVADSGHLLCVGALAVAQKEFIETSKMAHLRGDFGVSQLLWYLIHHWPVNVRGRGPMCWLPCITC